MCDLDKLMKLFLHQGNRILKTRVPSGDAREIARPSFCLQVIAVPTKTLAGASDSASRAPCGPSGSLALSGLLILPLYPKKSDRTSCSDLLGDLGLSWEGLVWHRWSQVGGPTFILQRRSCCW